MVITNTVEKPTAVQTVVAAYQTIQCHDPKDHNLNSYLIIILLIIYIYYHIIIIIMSHIIIACNYEYYH
jgi:hypothetical protein